MKSENKSLRSLGEAFNVGVKLLRIALIAGLAIYAFSGVKNIQPNESAIILRLGRIVGRTEAGRIRGAGLLLGFPYPIDEVVRVRVREVNELEIGDLWYSTELGKDGRVNRKSLSPSIDPTEEGYCITGDQYIVQPRVTVKYQVNDLVFFALLLDNPEQLIRNVVVAEFTQKIGSMTVDEVLTGGKKHLVNSVLKATQDILDTLNAGISLLSVEFKEVVPPGQVIQAFQNVVSAGIQRKTEVEKAKSYRAEKIPGAESEANTIIREAEAYQLSILAKARSDVTGFESLLIQYGKDPKVVRRRLYQEALEHIFSNVGRQYIFPKVGPGQKSPTFRLLLPSQ